MYTVAYSRAWLIGFYNILQLADHLFLLFFLAFMSFLRQLLVSKYLFVLYRGLLFPIRMPPGLSSTEQCYHWLEYNDLNPSCTGWQFDLWWNSSVFRQVGLMLYAFSIDLYTHP